MSEKMTAIRFKKDSNRPSEDEWLGPESHMPNLSRELPRFTTSKFPAQIRHMGFRPEPFILRRAV